METIEDAYDAIDFVEGFLLEEDEEHQIWLDGPYIRVPVLDIDIYPGQYLQYDEEEQAYLSDFTIFVFMKLGTKEVLYDEGYTSLEAAIHNYRRINNRLDDTELIFEIHQ